MLLKTGYKFSDNKLKDLDANEITAIIEILTGVDDQADLLLSLQPKKVRCHIT